MAYPFCVMTFSSLFGIDQMSFKQRSLGILLQLSIFYRSSNFWIYLFQLGLLSQSLVDKRGKAMLPA